MSIVSLESLAGRINREHEAALREAGSAIEHARSAGKLLLEARERSEGKWLSWLSEHCPQIAERTAQKYMQIARHPALEAESIGEALLKLAAPRQSNNPPGRAAPQAIDSKRKETPEARENTHPVEVSAERHAEVAKLREPEQPATQAKPANDESEGAEPEGHEAGQLEAALKEQDAAIERVLGTAGVEELKRQAAEIAILKQSRDGFMNGKAAVEKLLATEQRKVTRLQKRIEELEAEVTKLRARQAA